MVSVHKVKVTHQKYSKEVEVIGSGDVNDALFVSRAVREYGAERKNKGFDITGYKIEVLSSRKINSL